MGKKIILQGPRRTDVPPQISITSAPKQDVNDPSGVPYGMTGIGFKRVLADNVVTSADQLEQVCCYERLVNIHT